MQYQIANTIHQMLTQTIQYTIKIIIKIKSSDTEYNQTRLKEESE